MWVCLSNYGSLTHVSESWTLTTDTEQKIDACENRWLHQLLRINYKDRITNREIRERTKMIQLSSRIRRMRMKWTGHILHVVVVVVVVVVVEYLYSASRSASNALMQKIHVSDNKTVKQVFRWEPSSRWSRGRPKKCWMDCVEEDLHRAGIFRYSITTGRQRVSLQEIAGDRSQWRELVAASTAGTSFVMTTWPDLNITYIVSLNQQ